MAAKLDIGNGEERKVVDELDLDGFPPIGTKSNPTSTQNISVLFFK